MQGRYLVIKRCKIQHKGCFPQAGSAVKAKKSSQEQNLPPTQLGWGHRDEFRKALLRITQMGLLSPWSPGLEEARPARCCSPASCPSELRAAALSEAHRRQLSTPRRAGEGRWTWALRSAWNHPGVPLESPLQQQQMSCNLGDCNRKSWNLKNLYLFICFTANWK